MSFPRRSFLLSALLATISFTTITVEAHAQTAALLPVPTHVSWGTTTQPFGSVSVTWEKGASPLLRRATDRFQVRVTQLSPLSIGAPPLHLTIHTMNDPAFLTTDMKEAYRLTVSGTNVTLEAPGQAGVLRGLATLLQLVHKSDGGAVISSATIDDTPRFRWRGLMLDASRHLQTIATVERQLDAMELTKLNVLHWHLSDGIGFRVESRRYPKLQQFGSHGDYYTQAEIRAVVAYAADRGIRIVPEFDVPGHTLDILRAYPALAAQQPVPYTPGWKVPCATSDNVSGETEVHCERNFNHNTAALNPINPAVLTFIDELFEEMSGLFPDRYFHTGGDEVQGDQWTTNPQIAAYLKSHNLSGPAALQALFTAEVEKRLARHGKIMMGWDEVSEAPIPKNVVVEVWRNPKWTASATRAGHPVVVSSGYYLDLLEPSVEHYAVDPEATVPSPLSSAEADALRATIAAHKYGAFTTNPDTPPLTAAQRSLLLGAEAPLWTEVVTENMTDERFWPRSAAIAERYWSAPTVKDVNDLMRRLPLVLNELEATGLQASQHQALMIDALTPSNVIPLTLLTRFTVPVTDYAFNGLQTRFGDDIFASPAAIASPDSFSAWRFNALSKSARAGDKAAIAEVRTTLSNLGTLDQTYATVATAPALQRALPTAQAIASLSRLALQALEPGAERKALAKQAAPLLDAQDATFRTASAVPGAPHKVVPDSGLLIAILPGLHTLLDPKAH